MSYDINLFAPVPGESPIVTAHRNLDEDESTQPLALESKSRNARIASRLRELDTAFDIRELVYGTEVNWQRNNSAFQIFLADSSGTLNMPYWSENRNQELFALISTALRIVHEEAGFLAFDPQSNQLITLDGQSKISAQLFDVGVDALGSDVKDKPWWKFW